MSARRKAVFTLTLLTVGAALLVSASACSPEQRARRALKRVIYKEIDQFNKYHQREVKPNVYESGGSFYRIYHERVDPVVNMRRTNSVDTPYIATIRFTENIYLTRRHPTMNEGRRDVHYILSNSGTREIVYAYTGGSWKKKEVY